MKRKAFLIPVIVIVIPLLLVAALQPALKYALVYLLEQQGAEAVNLESARINPFKGRIVLTDWSVDQSGENKMQLRGLMVDIAVLDLFQKKLTIEELVLDNTVVAVEKHPLKEVLQVIGITLPEAAGENGSEPGGEPTDWQISLQRFVINQLTLDVQHPLFNGELHLQDVVITDLDSSNPKQVASISAQMKIGQTELQLGGEIKPFAKTREFNLQLTLNTFGLPLIQPLLADQSIELVGEAATRLDMDVEIAPDDRVSITSQGSGELKNIGAKLQGMQLDELALNWLGQFSVTLQADGALDVVIDNLELDGLNLAFILDQVAAGEVAQNPGDQAEAKPAGESASKDAAFRLVIRSLLLKGDNQMVFNDRRMSPEMVLPVSIEHLMLSDLDSGSPQQLAKLQFKGQIQKHGKVEFDSELGLFDKHPVIQVQGEAKDIELLPLSAYTVSAIGHSMGSGQFSSEFDVDIASNKLTVEDQLVFRNLTLNPSNNDKTKEFLSALPMSLDSALSLLRDDDNVIELTLPISGDLDNPEFELQGVINKALGKALKESSMSYLKFALQPYGAALMLAQFAGEQMSKVRLDPIVYMAGTTDITRESQPYLSKLMDLLNNRKQISVTLCSKSVPADRLAIMAARTREIQEAANLQEKAGEQEQKKLMELQAQPQVEIEPVTDKQLLELATSRSEQLKDLLINQGNIEPGRLFLCESEILDTKDAAPATVLEI
jgi:hypothetical protein